MILVATKIPAKTRKIVPGIPQIRSAEYKMIIKVAIRIRITLSIVPILFFMIFDFDYK